MTKKQTTMTFQIDPDLKKEVSEIAEDCGVSVTAITRAFYEQIVRAGSVPFNFRNDSSVDGIVGMLGVEDAQEAKTQHRLKPTFSEAHDLEGNTSVYPDIDCRRFDDFQRRLGQRLKLLRKANGLTQADVGAKIDISRVAVGYIEQGRRTPSASTLHKFSRLYGMTISELTDISGTGTLGM